MDEDAIQTFIASATRALANASFYQWTNDSVAVAQCLEQARRDIESAIEEGEKCKPEAQA